MRHYTSLHSKPEKLYFRSSVTAVLPVKSFTARKQVGISLTADTLSASDASKQTGWYSHEGFWLLHLSMSCVTDSSHCCRGEREVPQVAQLRLPRNRQRWNLQRSTDTATTADDYSSLSSDPSQAPGQLPGQDEEGLVPLSVVMDACMVQSVVQQYQCVSKACLG